MKKGISSREYFPVTVTDLEEDLNREHRLT